MFNFYNASRIAVLSGLLVAIQCSAQDSASLKIIPVPGKTICQAASMQIGSNEGKAELCVTQGNFAHDVYALRLDKKLLLKGIDDETTQGLSTTYQEEKLTLVCTPQNKAPDDISPEKIAAYQQMMKVSAEDARKMIMAVETTEIGRRCSVSLGQRALMNVEVVFE